MTLARRSPEANRSGRRDPFLRTARSRPVELVDTVEPVRLAQLQIMVGDAGNRDSPTVEPVPRLALVLPCGAADGLTPDADVARAAGGGSDASGKRPPLERRPQVSRAINTLILRRLSRLEGETAMPLPAALPSWIMLDGAAGDYAELLPKLRTYAELGQHWRQTATAVWKLGQEAPVDSPVKLALHAYRFMAAAKQVGQLYRRTRRIFPARGGKPPSALFWSSPTTFG
jgi:hypothetical protein